MNNSSNITFPPFCYFGPSVKTMSTVVLILSVPQIVFLVLTSSYASLILITVAILAAVFSEMVENIIYQHRTLSDGTAIVEGLLIGMFLPQNYPVINAFFIILLSLFIAKHLFGTLGSAWAAPSAVTLAILYFFGVSSFPGFLINVSMIEGGNLVNQLLGAQKIVLQPWDPAVTQIVNSTIFKYVGVTIPEGYLTLFVDTGLSIPAFRFNLVTLASSLVLISMGIIKWIIPASFLLVYGILVRFFAFLPFTGQLGQGDILLAFLTSGTLFMAFFMLHWYGTTPLSSFGQLLYGMLAGTIAFLLCGFGTSPTGAFFTVLVANLFSPIIQLCEDKFYLNVTYKKIWSRFENER